MLTLKPTLTMPGTVDDFMNRFGGGGTIDDSEAQQLHDRFVSTNPDDRAFDNQTYHQSAPQDRQGLLGGLLGALAGGASGDVASKLGLASADPSKMSADDAARL